MTMGKGRVAQGAVLGLCEKLIAESISHGSVNRQSKRTSLQRFFSSIVLGVEFKILLRVQTGGAYLRRGFSGVEIAAVAAVPLLLFRAAEHQTF